MNTQWRVSHAHTDTDMKYVIDGHQLGASEVRQAIHATLGTACTVTEVEALNASGAGYGDALLIRIPTAAAAAVRAWEASGLTLSVRGMHACMSSSPC